MMISHNDLDAVLCADAFDVFKRVPDNFVDLVLTDIPYNVVNRDSGGLRNFNKGDADQITFDLSKLIEETVRVCSGSIYIFCSTEQVSELRAGFVSAGLTTRLGIWEKTNPSPINGEHLWLSSIETCIFARKSKAVFNERCKGTVWRFATDHDFEKETIHPTIKPLKLFEYLLQTSSNRNQIIFDPFVGSGTTAIAAKRNGRKYIVCDFNIDYVNLTKRRLAHTLTTDPLFYFPVKNKF